MAADLYIHIMTKDMTEDHLASFFCNHIGSKWEDQAKDWEAKYSNGAVEIISNSPAIHVGEVSWLKAALFEDSESFVPNAIGAISDIIGEDLPIIDDELIGKIEKALSMPNTTSYHVSKTEEIVSFLKEHKGKRAFTVSW